MQALLLNAVDVFFRVIYILIFVRIILSWLPIGRGGGIGELLYALTEPILGPIRSMLDRSPIGGGMMLDFSPIIALFVMDIVEMILKAIIRMI